MVGPVAVMNVWLAAIRQALPAGLFHSAAVGLSVVDSRVALSQEWGGVMGALRERMSRGAASAIRAK